MSLPVTDKVSAAMNDTDAVLRALRKAQIKAMRRHIFGNVPMVVWKDGAVAKIPPSDLIKELERLGVPLFGPSN